MDCILRSYNAREAVRHGKALTAVDRMILMRSDPLTHSEFQFSDRFNGLSFSSTMQDGDDGCRFKAISYSHPERWTTLIIPMDDDQEDRAMHRAQDINGKKYDLLGLGSFSSELSIIKPDPNKYWCSEACAELIKAAYFLGENFVPHKFTPVGLFFTLYDEIAIHGLTAA
jgi:hypothetical protein